VINWEDKESKAYFRGRLNGDFYDKNNKRAGRYKLTELAEEYVDYLWFGYITEVNEKRVPPIHFNVDRKDMCDV